MWPHWIAIFASDERKNQYAIHKLVPVSFYTQQWCVHAFFSSSFCHRMKVTLLSIGIVCLRRKIQWNRMENNSIMKLNRIKEKWKSNYFWLYKKQPALCVPACSTACDRRYCWWWNQRIEIRFVFEGNHFFSSYSKRPKRIRENLI